MVKNLKNINNVNLYLVLITVILVIFFVTILVLYKNEKNTNVQMFLYNIHEKINNRIANIDLQ